MKSIVVLNNKGGVGKTTSVVNLAAAFAKAGKKTLVIDLDPSASATMHLGIEKAPTLCDYILDEEGQLNNFIMPTAFEKLDCIPSEPALSEFYDEMVQEQETQFFIKTEDLPTKYSYVLFDCPPNMGALGLNALAIADFVLIPVQTQFMALTGLELTLKSVAKVQRRLNPNLKILGYFATMFDRRTRVAKNVLHLLQERFKKELFKTAISINSKLIEAFDAQKPILHKTPSARGAKEYVALAKEVMNRIKRL